MSDIALLPDEEQSGDNKAALIEGQLDRTRAVRDRIAMGLSNLFDDIMKDFNSGQLTTNGNRQRPTDIEEFDKVTKLLLKSLSDNDKVDLTRLRIVADQSMNDDNIAAARANTSELLANLGKLSVHPGAIQPDNVIEGESVRVVTPEERDQRLGLAMLDRFNDVSFDPGVLIQGRVEENSDAFYARLKSMTALAAETAAAQNQASESNN